jgi:hypothetical protein
MQASGKPRGFMQMYINLFTRIVVLFAWLPDWHMEQVIGCCVTVVCCGRRIDAGMSQLMPEETL